MVNELSGIHTSWISDCPLLAEGFSGRMPNVDREDGYRFLFDRSFARARKNCCRYCRQMGSMRNALPRILCVITPSISDSSTMALAVGVANASSMRLTAPEGTPACNRA